METNISFSWVATELPFLDVGVDDDASPPSGSIITDSHYLLDSPHSYRDGPGIADAFNRQIIEIFFLTFIKYFYEYLMYRGVGAPAGGAAQYFQNIVVYYFEEIRLNFRRKVYHEKVSSVENEIRNKKCMKVIVRVDHCNCYAVTWLDTKFASKSDK